MKTTEISFVPHCDDYSCNLGCGKFHCPVCEAWNTKYDYVWWEYTDLYSGKIIETTCDKCKTALFIFRDFVEEENYVSFVEPCKICRRVDCQHL